MQINPRTDPPFDGDERATLTGFLRYQRETLEMKCAGLDAEALARRAVEPSTLSLLGLVRHLAEVVRRAMSSAAADGPSSMTNVTCQLSVSLDGYVAGPNQSAENPIGEGGLRLHHWAFDTASWREQQGLSGGQDDVDSQVAAEVMSGIGAFVMGRHMFDPGRGAWDESWRGWWGDDPPYHAPVFVLTHHPRESIVMEGGTTFHFVTEGIESALAQAREAAGDANVSIAGGASVVRQYLRAGLLDEMHLHVAPIVLGAGERLLDDVGTPALEQVQVRSSPVVTHIRYRVVRG